MANYGLKKRRDLIQTLKEVRDTATMENCDLDGMFEKNPFDTAKEKYKNSGTPVTDFIRDRTDKHHWRSSWILRPLERVITELEDSLQ